MNIKFYRRLFALILIIHTRAICADDTAIKWPLHDDGVLNNQYPQNAPCPLKLKRASQYSCTLTQWANKIFSMKERPFEISSLPLKKDYTAAILKSDEFLATIEQCASLIESEIQNKQEWQYCLSLKEKSPNIFNLNRTFYKIKEASKNFIFKPYAQKLILQPNSKVIIFGDLHGSAHSFIRILLKLRKDGLLNDKFQIIKPLHYMLFLGDYIDRGIYGTEVIYTLMRLKLANGPRVILVRGNHEDYNTALDFTPRHRKAKQKDTAPSFLDELARKFGIKYEDEVKIYRLYDILPVVLYLGCKNGCFVNYLQCCHGGLEIGYDPKDFLENCNSKFDLIQGLWRERNFKTKLNQNIQKMIKRDFTNAMFLSEIRNFVPKAPLYMVNKYNHVMTFGFLWNDFYIDKSKGVGQRHFMFGSWIYGYELTKAILSWANSCNVKLNGIIRAHQHNNEGGGPMLNLLCCNKGIVNIWNDNLAYTTISAPDSKLDETGEQCFTYDSYLILTTAAKYKDWKIIHHWQDYSIKRATWKSKSVKY